MKFCSIFLKPPKRFRLSGCSSFRRMSLFLRKTLYWFGLSTHDSFSLFTSFSSLSSSEVLKDYTLGVSTSPKTPAKDRGAVISASYCNGNSSSLWTASSIVLRSKASSNIPIVTHERHKAYALPYVLSVLPGSLAELSWVLLPITLPAASGLAFYVIPLFVYDAHSILQYGWTQVLRGCISENKIVVALTRESLLTSIAFTQCIILGRQP